MVIDMVQTVKAKKDKRARIWNVKCGVIQEDGSVSVMPQGSEVSVKANDAAHAILRGVEIFKKKSKDRGLDEIDIVAVGYVGSVHL